MKRYQVIGGQYEPYWYGESDTLRGAKIIATKNMEHWDNWQGWHKPSIYLDENTKTIEAKGYTTHADGETIIVPNGEPLLYWGLHNDVYQWNITFHTQP